MNKDWIITTYDEQARIIHQFQINDVSWVVAMHEAKEDPRVTGEEDPRVKDWSIMSTTRMKVSTDMKWKP